MICTETISTTLKKVETLIIQEVRQKKCDDSDFNKMQVFFQTLGSFSLALYSFMVIACTEYAMKSEVWLNISFIISRRTER